MINIKINQFLTVLLELLIAVFVKFDVKFYSEKLFREGLGVIQSKTYLAEAYLGPYQTSTFQFFCKNTYLNLYLLLVYK